MGWEAGGVGEEEGVGGFEGGVDRVEGAQALGIEAMVVSA